MSTRDPSRSSAGSPTAGAEDAPGGAARCRFCSSVAVLPCPSCGQPTCLQHLSIDEDACCEEVIVDRDGSTREHPECRAGVEAGWSAAPVSTFRAPMAAGGAWSCEYH